jgi:uncharacterized membrane protein
MSTYELLLFAHLLFVVTWVGSDICLQVLGTRAIRAGAAQAVEFTASVEVLGKYMLTPAALLVLLFGVLLVNEVGYEFSQTWITIGFAAFAFSAALGAGFLGPESGRISKLVAERGEEDAEVQRRIRRIFLLSRVELVVLIGAILDMAVKPGL